MALPSCLPLPISPSLPLRTCPCPDLGHWDLSPLQPAELALFVSQPMGLKDVPKQKGPGTP